MSGLSELVERVGERYRRALWAALADRTAAEMAAVVVRLALDELAGAVVQVQADAAPAPAKTVGPWALKRLEEWLWEYGELETATDDDPVGEMIRMADRLRGRVVYVQESLKAAHEECERLRVELAEAIVERNAADEGCAEAERAGAQFWDEANQANEDMNAEMNEKAALRQQLIALDDYALAAGVIGEADAAERILCLAKNQSEEIRSLRQELIELDADNARLTQELATLRSFWVAPKVDGIYFGIATNGDVPTNAQAVTDAAPTAAPEARGEAEDCLEGGAGLVWDDDLADWVAGIEAGRHTFRGLPRAVRWQLVACVVREALRVGSGGQSEFDALRPEWMSTARASVLTFGDGKWERVIEMVRAGEVVR
jgi:hypothetical protein